MLTPEEIAKVRQSSGASPLATGQTQNQSLSARLGIPTAKPEQPKDLLGKAAGVAEKVLSFTGGNKIAEALGAQMAKSVNPDQAKYITAPTGKEVVGDIVRTAVNFTPLGRIAKGFSLGAKALGLGSKVSKVLGNVGAGAATGYTFDVGTGLAEGEGIEALKPGIGTGIGAAVPLAGPVIKGVSRVAGEFFGISTGAGFGNVKKGFESMMAGGEKSASFRAGITGKTSSESLVQEAKDAFQVIKTKRRNNYITSMKNVKEFTQPLSISPIVSEVGDQLKKFNVFVKGDGALDFSRSAIRFDKPAQDTIEQIVNTMKGFGTRKGDRTVVGVDLLKQALDDLYTPSSKVRSFVQAVKDTARSVANKVPGYEEMSKNYNEASNLIRDISKGLSLGDKASVDTAFRKLTSALRQNNEMRRKFVAELDEAAGGALSSKIAGQQLSALLPRGLAGVLSGVGGAASIGLGVAVLPLLKVAALTSPRLIGELVSVLGFTGRVAKNLTREIETKFGKLKFPGDAIMDRVEKTPSKQGGFVSLGKGESFEDAVARDIDNLIDKAEASLKDLDTLSYLEDMKKKVSKKGSKLTDEEKRLYNITAKGLGMKELAIESKAGSFKQNSTTGKMEGSVGSVSKELESLAEEARKYKSAEEFVKAQGEPVYRGGLAIDKSQVSDMGISVAKDKVTADAYAGSDIIKGGDKGNITGGAVHKLYINPNAKILNAKDAPKDLVDFYLKEGRVTGREKIVDYAKQNGYDGVDFSKFSDPETRVFNPDILKTKSQLTDFYNKVKGKK